jgi:hypothetical protein
VLVESEQRKGGVSRTKRAQEQRFTIEESDGLRCREIDVDPIHPSRNNYLIARYLLEEILFIISLTEKNIFLQFGQHELE